MVRPKIPSKQHLKPHGVTFTEEEKVELRLFAKETGVSISAYIRELTAKDKANRETLLKAIEIVRKKAHVSLSAKYKKPEIL